MALNCKKRKKFTHLQFDPILICLARNCKRTATAAVAALVQKRKIVGQTLKKRSWWSCLEKMKISCDTKRSPEWLSIARQLHSRCKKQNVDSDKTPKQCKNKLANLTKKYKNTKDKLRSTGYGRGGDVPSDNESEENEDIIPKHFNDMDEILGKRESINPRHVLESSHVPDSESPEISELERDILEKDALDEEICPAAQKQREGCGCPRTGLFVREEFRQTKYTRCYSQKLL